jgi:HSP20 family protein
MMNDDVPEMFRQMDAMMARLMRGMDAGFAGSVTDGATGYRIIIESGGFPFAERDAGYGTGGGNPPRDSPEPAVEVHHLGDEVKVVAELPGITEELLRLDVREGRLVIDAGDAGISYRTSAELPPVEEQSMQKSLRNGVLEVTFRALKTDGSPEGDTKT